MPVATGTEVYSADVLPVTARGAVYSGQDLTDALDDHVSALLRDDSGIKALDDMFTGLAATSFQQQTLKSILYATTDPPSWRVGEALAEAFLKDHRQCEFPWPGGRDLKNPDASAAGTDLVGFRRQNGSVRFAFGEVKTSNHAEWPPSLMYGRHGLKEQSELCICAKVKNHLVKYLGLHAENASWKATFIDAATRYITDPEDVSIFGMLIRDVRPDCADLRARAESLSKLRRATTQVELRAIYLPSGSIAALPQMANAATGCRP